MKSFAFRNILVMLLTLTMLAAPRRVDARGLMQMLELVTLYLFLLLLYGISIEIMMSL